MDGTPVTLSKITHDRYTLSYMAERKVMTMNLQLTTDAPAPPDDGTWPTPGVFVTGTYVETRDGAITRQGTVHGRWAPQGWPGHLGHPGDEELNPDLNGDLATDVWVRRRYSGS